jgi:CheY-like chemotaxis protein
LGNLSRLSSAGVDLKDAFKTKARKTIGLIVDDDLASRELLASYLEPEGGTIVTVSTGTEAVEEARRSLPDLVVTDVLMPGSGGLQTLVCS